MYENYDDATNLDNIFEEFKMRHPLDVNKIAKWHPKGEGEIVVELDDGSAYLYDNFEKTSRWVSSVDKLKIDVSDKKKWRMEFAIHLYRRMKILGFTQSDLAWESGISEGSITKYMNGQSLPTAYNLIRLAKVLDCTVDDLLYF